MKWIRPAITLVAMVGLTAAFFMGKITSDAFVGVATLAITWWFKSRDEEKSSTNTPPA